ncbi:MAG: SDR family NAD(P)-dependent oxidoreductase, partial [Anaeromyxobacteraceae bacterium]
MTRTNVVITGATSGIGRTTALHLARAGFNVFATGRDPAALSTLADEATGLPLTPLRLDVTDPASLEAARAAVLAQTGGAGLDAVINNAGYAHAQPLEDVEPSQLMAQLATNTVGAHAVTRAFLPEMRRRRAGRVVFVGSIAGRIAIPLLGAYDVSKHALEALADAYRRELHAFGIRVVLLRPGFIHSALAARTSAHMLASAPSGSPYEQLYRSAGSLERVAQR